MSKEKDTQQILLQEDFLANHSALQEKENQLLIRCEHSANYETNLFSQGITENFAEQEQFDLKIIQDVAERYAGTLTQEKDSQVDRLIIQLTKTNPKKSI